MLCFVLSLFAEIVDIRKEANGNHWSRLTLFMPWCTVNTDIPSQSAASWGPITNKTVNVCATIQTLFKAWLYGSSWPVVVAVFILQCVSFRGGNNQCFTSPCAACLRHYVKMNFSLALDNRKGVKLCKKQKWRSIKNQIKSSHTQSSHLMPVTWNVKIKSSISDLFVPTMW